MKDQHMENRGDLELSRPLAVERLGEAVRQTRIVASAAERAALAARFGLVALERLEAALRVRAAGAAGAAGTVGPGRRVRVDGHVDAVAVQTCVVSLEPVRSELGEDFTQLYDLDPVESPVREVTVAPGPEDDEAEPLGPGGLDLGEAVAQQLASMLDPYPRAPDASLPAAATDPGGRAEGGGRRPFGILGTLKAR